MRGSPFSTVYRTACFWLFFSVALFGCTVSGFAVVLEQSLEEADGRAAGMGGHDRITVILNPVQGKVD